MEYKKFNINNRVRIKLTDVGCKILADDFNIWSPSEKRSPEYYKNKCDEYGFYEMQLWLLINVFGNFISMGLPNPFENNNILFKDEDLENLV